MSAVRIYLPDGSFFDHEPGGCLEHGETKWEVVRRWVKGKDLDGNPVERESISCHCPDCMAFGPDGRNRHGRIESRQPLGRFDAATGALELFPGVEPYSPPSHPEPAVPESSPADPQAAAIFKALHWPDGSAARWAMRKASGLSDRDLRAAVAYELISGPPPPGHTASGGLGHAQLAITLPSGPTILDVVEVASRARDLIGIPARYIPDPAEVWAVRARTSDLILYGIEADSLAEAAELMEPDHVGDDVLRFERVKPSKIPAFVEIRRPAIPLSVARAPAAAGAIKPAELAGPRPRGEARASLFGEGDR